jgi:hypothetical protein
MGENTRDYLESLTTRELMRMADREGIDIPPDLERVFIIQELLENDRPEDAAPEPAGGAFFQTAGTRSRQNPVPLPRQYNITYLETLPRDPLWVFAFWEIKRSDKEVFENLGNFEGYCLKVSSLGFPEGKGEGPRRSPKPNGARRQVPGRKAPAERNVPPDTAFTVPVGTEDTAWYLGFPPLGGEFKVELCVTLGDSREARREEASVRFKTLAVSRPFFTPRLFNPSENEETLKNPLIRLSGADYLSAPRSRDRFSRYGIL